LTAVRSWEATINNNLVAEEAVGTRLIGALEPSDRDYDGRFTLLKLTP